MRITDGIRFRVIPDWVLASVSPPAVVAYAVLQRFARDTAAQVSQDRLAKELGCSVRSVRNWLQELEDAGAIQVQRQRGEAGSFRVNEILVLDTPAERADERATSFPSPQATDCPRPEATVCLQDLREENSQRIQDSPGGRNAPAAEAPDRRALFQVLAEAAGLDISRLTRAERGRLNRATKDLAEVGASPDEVRRRAAIHRSVWPTASLTATSLAANWTLLGQSESGEDRRARLVQEGLAWTR